MNRKVKGFIILGSAICVILFANLYFNTTYHSTATSGLVINKESSPLSITLKTFGDTSSEIKVMRILIKDENIWNLIELNRYYFVKYDWKNNEIPSLGQIMINDEFGEIYKNKLNN
jgi:hypothetical protein